MRSFERVFLSPYSYSHFSRRKGSAEPPRPCVAAAAFCAIPITWVTIAVVGALVGLCAYMASASKHTAALSDEMGELREKGDDLRATDQLRMERLQQLAEKENLNNAEMQEAERLSNQLKARYGGSRGSDPSA